METLSMPAVYALARRTLGYSERDQRPIPWEYTAALTRYAAQYPEDLDFTIDLHRLGGVVTCIPCQHSFVVGQPISPGLFVFQDLNLLGDHNHSNVHKLNRTKGDDQARTASTNNHHPAMLKKTASGPKSGPTPKSPSPRPNINLQARSLGDIEAPTSSDAEPFSSDVEQGSSSKAPSIIELSSDSDSSAPSNKHISQYTFPDGEVIEIESSDEESMPSVPIPRQTSSMLGTPRPFRAGGSSSMTTPRPSSSGVTLNRPAPAQRGQPQMPWSIHRSRQSSPESVASLASGARKRSIQHTDGEFDESADEQLGYSSMDTEDREGRLSKRARYGMLPEAPTFDEDEEEEEEDYLGLQATGRARADTIMPGNFALDPMVAIPYPPDILYGSVAYQNGYQPYLNDALIMPAVGGSNLVNPTMGYHAPLVGMEMPIPRPIASGSGNRLSHGFNLNYDNESPVTWLDTNGPNHALQLQKFFDDAMDDHEGAIPVRDAAKTLGLSSTTDRLLGMQVPLMPHQLIGVAWMEKQELGNVAGGILADDMGLGKTMQTIALIVKNPPEKRNPRKSTLVVAPAALLDQWKDEILSRTDDGLLKVKIHHGKDKLRSAAEVKKYDIIITTFQTLTNEFPSDEIDLRKKKSEKKKKKSKQGTLDHFIVDDSSDEGTSKKKASGYGPLAATKWYRVVIDEAQNIRNRSTRSSRVMAMLDSEYRWALTGTPVTNTLADLYGLVRFLHFAPFNDWPEFNEKIAKVQKRDPKLAGRRAQALLKKCLLRRTKDSKLEGKPLITLPPKTIDMEMLEFSPDERQIYAAVEARQQQKLNKFIRAGTVMKNYHVILVMLLRLRQVCNHPQLIAYAAGEFIADGAHVVSAEEDDNEPKLGGSSLANSKTTAKALMGDERFNLVTREFHNTAKEMIRAELTGGDMPDDDETLECQVCLEPFVGNARVTTCGHVFCEGCLVDLFKRPLQGEAAANEDFGAGRQYAGQEVRPCPKCRGELTMSRIFSASIFEPNDREKDEIKRQVETELGRTDKYKLMHADADDDDDDFVPIRKGKGKGKSKARIEDDEDEVDLKGMGEGEDLVPGAKMSYMLNLLKTWHKEAPEDKVIAYSQWTSMIDLMQILLRKSGFESLRYDGQMKREEREETLSRFKKQGGPKILLISLKCGGVGLNLTEANRVVCMDLAWNAATENQAIDRAHRMGQVKPVAVKRLAIKDTIEERILKLQADKQNLSDAALGEGNGTKMPRMNVAQLKMLFGLAK
ncbi:SNF2 family amino-terminal protein [Rhizoctonia solani AG-3 Rhs1AP]|uniref:SNF2 family amino-terminal protein n=1 Tax=Rhizoctonia solani AG-3 Rhs1AP TaxID=1086054 RepID=X8JFZ6_9AGAM|nr:SNF2 family amino-terminal protein [Rhizoctonia solani AG-3 Rhs1AP]